MKPIKINMYVALHNHDNIPDWYFIHHVLHGLQPKLY